MTTQEILSYVISLVDALGLRPFISSSLVVTTAFGAFSALRRFLHS